MFARLQGLSEIMPCYLIYSDFDEAVAVLKGTMSTFAPLATADRTPAEEDTAETIPRRNGALPVAGAFWRLFAAPLGKAEAVKLIHAAFPDVDRRRRDATFAFSLGPGGVRPDPSTGNVADPKACV
jgi:hypothetical protein